MERGQKTAVRTRLQVQLRPDSTPSISPIPSATDLVLHRKISLSRSPSVRHLSAVSPITLQTAPREREKERETTLTSTGTRSLTPRAAGSALHSRTPAESLHLAALFYNGSQGYARPG